MFFEAFSSNHLCKSIDLLIIIIFVVNRKTGDLYQSISCYDLYNKNLEYLMNIEKENGVGW